MTGNQRGAGYAMAAALLTATLLTPTASRAAPDGSARNPTTAVDPSPALAGDALEDVLVTATKQVQNLQRAPAAITAVDGNTLLQQGVTDIRGAQALMPSARFQQENASTEIYIRGVGSTLDFPQIEPPTAFNLDGIAVPREASSVPLYDIDHLEVLPGPQGTLYGRSTLGGAVNVTFRRPSQDFETHAALEVGRDSLVHVSAAENLPVTRSFAIRVAGDVLDHDGYMASGADSQRDWGGRVSLLYAPSDALSVYAWGSTVGKEGHPPNLVVKGVNPATGQLDPDAYLHPNAWNDQLPAPYSAGLPFGQPKAERQSYDNTMAGGELTARLADTIELKYVPSYLDMTASPNYWLGAFPGHEDATYRQTSHELRLAGTPPWGTWLAGLYAYRLESHGQFIFGGFTLATGFPVSLVDHNRISGEAAFGQVSVHIAERTRLTVGGRYSGDRRNGDGRFLAGQALAPFTYDRDFSHVDYEVGIEHDLASHAMVYATTQTAYQPGTFNPYASTPSASNAVDPAHLTAYTLGLKSRSLEERLQLNDEVFFYDYRGLFASAYNTVLNATQTFNVQTTHVYGNQLDLLFKATRADQLQLALGYLHGRYTHFSLPDGSARFDGYQMQYAPDWTLQGTLSHDLSLPRGYVRFTAGSRFESAFYADFSHTPGGRQQAYAKTDASVTYFSADRWSVGAFIRNATNVAVIAATAGGSNLPLLSTAATAFLEAPRTYGVRGTWDF